MARTFTEAEVEQIITKTAAKAIDFVVEELDREASRIVDEAKEIGPSLAGIAVLTAALRFTTFANRLRKKDGEL